MPRTSDAPLSLSAKPAKPSAKTIPDRRLSPLYFTRRAFGGFASRFLAGALAGLAFVACADDEVRPKEGSAHESAISATAPSTSLPATPFPPSTATPLPGAAPATATLAGAPTPSASAQRDQDLIAAAARGDLAAVRSLLDGGASITARDASARTALIAAAYGGHLEVAEALIARGADVNAKDNPVQSAYLIATSEIGDSPNTLAFLRLMLRSGADVGSLDSYNGTGLIRAADRGFVTIVQELLRTRINIDHVNRLGWTALLEAIILGGGDARHTEVVGLLVGAGANVNLADGNGKSPLAHARDRGYREMAAILEAAGAR